MCLPAAGTVRDRFTSDWSDLDPQALVRGLDPQNPCGPVAAAVVSHGLGRPVTLAEFKQHIHCDPLGRCSLSELGEGLRLCGFHTMGIRLNARSMRGVKLPLVLYMNGNHFVAGLPHPSGSTSLVDPPNESQLIDLCRLGSRWSGECLLVASNAESLDDELRRLGLSKKAGD